MRISQASSNAYQHQKHNALPAHQEGRSPCGRQAVPRRRIRTAGCRSGAIGGTGDLVTGLVAGACSPAAWNAPSLPDRRAGQPDPPGWRTRPRDADHGTAALPPRALRCAGRGLPYAPAGRETVQTRAAPPLRILHPAEERLQKKPFLTVGAFFPKDSQEHSNHPYGKHLSGRLAFRWISLSVSPAETPPDRLSI